VLEQGPATDLDGALVHTAEPDGRAAAQHDRSHVRRPHVRSLSPVDVRGRGRLAPCRHPPARPSA
jgi:hypothetical protein